MYSKELEFHWNPYGHLKRTRGNFTQTRSPAPDESVPEKNAKETTIDPKKKSNFLVRIYDFVFLYLQTSSIHGFSHLTETKRHWTERLLWGLCIILSIVGCAFVSSISWNRYQNYPTVISMERDYKNWNTSMPSATLCSDRKIDFQSLTEWTETLGNSVNKTQATEFIYELASFSFGSFKNLTINEETIKPNDYMNLIYQNRFRFSGVDDSVVVDADIEIVPSITEFGICYIYNSDVSYVLSPAHFFRKGKKIKNQKNEIASNKIVLGNPSEGDTTVSVTAMNTNYKVTLTGPSEIPDSTAKFLSPKTRGLFELQVTALSIYSSADVKSLSVTQRKCKFRDESELLLGPIYTYNLCRMECRMNLAKKLCGCIPHFYKKTRGMKICDSKGLQCLIENDDLLVKLRNETRKVSCDCLPSCNEDYYLIEETAFYDNLWESQMKLRMINYPRIRLKREIIFGFSDFLSAIGGAAGLFLGCSFLSFIEIIYFFTLRLLTYCLKSSK